MSDKAPYIVFYVLAASFVATSLIGRRIPLGKAAKMAVAWIGIFAIGFSIFAFREEFSALWQRLRSEATGSPVVSGRTLRIPVSDDGHFWVDASVNGTPVRLLVDSGASVTTVSRATAAAAGVDVGGGKGVVNTANGRALVALGRADSFSVGPIERRDFAVDVSDQDDLELLGMNFLSSLRGWRVDGQYLVLEA